MKPKKTIETIDSLKILILKQKDEKSAFAFFKGYPTTLEISKWFNTNYGYKNNGKLSIEEAFSNLYFDVINELI